MKTTQAQFRAFKEAFLEMRDKLGLQHYTLYFEVKPISDAFAQIRVDEEACVATITMSAELSREEMQEFNPASTGRHECLHMLTHAMYNLATMRYLTPDEIMREWERLVVRLEGVV